MSYTHNLTKFHVCNRVEKLVTLSSIIYKFLSGCMNKKIIDDQGPFADG